MNLVVNGLLNSEKANRLKEVIMNIDGVSNVEITPPDRVKISYNPSKVYPSRLKAAMNSIGISTSHGG
jgi:copper chaperone CopZ